MERQRRLLKNHRHGLAAERRQFIVVEREHVAPHHGNLAGDLRALLRQ
jgi:hypothetical protein